MLGASLLSATLILAPAPVAAPAPQEPPGKVLRLLQASVVVTQALDTHSTLFALSRGASEANPVMTRIVDRRLVFSLLKGSVAVSTIIATEKLSKRHKTLAVVTLVVINGATAAIAARNYRIGQRLRR